MAWKKGESGNPAGRAREKPFLDALRIAMTEPDAEGTPKIRRIAQNLVDSALAGEAWAIQQIADRLDGKPVQQNDNTHRYDTDVSKLTDDELRAIISGPLDGGSGSDTTVGVDQ